MGDAIMAFWGAPRVTATHAEQAVAAAIGMAAALEELRGQLGALGEASRSASASTPGGPSSASSARTIGSTTRSSATR
jgi:adenylate cyclase